MPNIFSQGHALLIGVGSYPKATQLNAPITARDAQAVRTTLLNPALCGYPEQQVRLLTDQAATRAGVLQALDQLAGQATEESTVFIFYSGHGDYGTDGNYYLTTHDTCISDSKIMAGTGISNAELLDKLRTLRARRMLLIFNACHAGEISPRLAGPSAAETNAAGMSAQAVGSLSLPTQTTEALLSSGEGRIVITACREDQYSSYPLGADKLTFFAQALVDGLSGKGINANRGYISAFSLYEQVYRTVKEINEKIEQVQEPELTVLKGVGPFPVALFRGASTLGVFDASEEAPEETAFRQVEAARSQRAFKQIIRNVIASGDRAVAIGGDATGAIINTGDGTVVQGNQNTVVGAGGVLVKGNVRGDVVTGTKVTQKAGSDAIQIGQARDVKVRRE